MVWGASCAWVREIAKLAFCFASLFMDRSRHAQISGSRLWLSLQRAPFSHRPSLAMVAPRCAARRCSCLHGVDFVALRCLIAFPENPRCFYESWGGARAEADAEERFGEENAEILKTLSKCKSPATSESRHHENPFPFGGLLGFA